MKFLASTIVLLFFCLSLHAQSESSPATSKGDDYSKRYKDSSTRSTSNNDKKTARERLKSSPIMKYYDQKIVEYEKRMKANARKYKKMKKEMRKPQYSDPTYFGHKRPPKKRPPGKKKFCDVCEIVH